MACSRPYYDPSIVDFNGEPVPIPCGTCFCCRLDMQKTAMDRMFCAWQSHDVSAFVTFTYDDNHLVYKDGFLQPTLSKEDVHKYLDNLRHKLNNCDFEFYLCGEYGDKFNRPHYHAIFFGLDYELHKSLFEQTWKKGSVKVLPVNPASFRYVSKYIVKPYSREWNDKNYYDLGLIPPFRKMSRGLGLRVYLTHLDELREKGFFYLKGKRISVNRYYFNKLVSYSERQIFVREQSLYENRIKMTKEADSLGLQYSYYKHFKYEEREKNLRSRELKNNSHF